MCGSSLGYQLFQAQGMMNNEHVHTTWFTLQLSKSRFTMQFRHNQGLGRYIYLARITTNHRQYRAPRFRLQLRKLTLRDYTRLHM